MLLFYLPASKDWDSTKAAGRIRCSAIVTKNLAIAYLAVLRQHVGYTRNGWLASEAAVRAVVVVEV